MRRTRDNAIFGGASHDDFIPFGGLSKDQIFERLKECNKGKHGPMAIEVNFVVLSFQNRPKGMSPFFLFLANQKIQTNRINLC